jgi:hypothetical protein
MNASDIAALLWQSESETLDFKRDQYPFDNASDDQRSELLKDILAFANAWRSGPARILIGVDEVRHGRSLPIETQHLTNRNLQTFVNSKVNRPVTFSYDAYEIDGKSVGVIDIAVQDRPLYLNRRYGRLEANTVYIRRGDTTTIADPDEIAQMGAKHEQARKEPVLTFSLGNLEKRLKYGDAIRAETTCFEIPNTKTLPRYGSGSQFGININNENENYYSDTALFLRDVPHLQKYAIVVANESRTTAEQVVVRIHLIEPGVEVLAPGQQRAEPDRDRIMTLMTRLSRSTEIELEPGTKETTVKINMGDIQPGTEQWSKHSFFMGSRVSKGFRVAVSVSAHNLGEPAQFHQAFDFEVKTRSLSANEIVALADEF